MGYTHYFEHKKVSKETWEVIVADIKTIMANMPEFSHSSGVHYPNVPLKLANGSGTPNTYPIIGINAIRFNGEGPEYDHETFELKKEGSGGFEFCKTARKPYDLIVQACLIIYYHYSPGTIDIGSDGDSGEWEVALNFVNKTLHASMENPIKKKV